jgi:hypothetical protein
MQSSKGTEAGSAEDWVLDPFGALPPYTVLTFERGPCLSNKVIGRAHNGPEISTIHSTGRMC